MGLLEKAFEYKKEINRKGKTTLIDKIKGPADTEMQEGEPDNIFEKNKPIEDAIEDISDDLFELPKDDDFSPIETLKEQKNEIVNDRLKEPWQKKKNDIRSEDKIQSQKDNSDPDPLTEEDEPKLPKDIDRVHENPEDKDIFNESSPEPEIDDFPEDLSPESDTEIPAIEPYIIPDNDFEEAAETELLNEREIPVSDDIKDTEKNESPQNHYIDNANMQNNRHQENLTLYEIAKEISRSETKKALFEVVIFSVMGQIGSSSASIMMRSPENDKWVIVNSSGLQSAEKNFSYDANSGILKNIKKDIIDIEELKDEEDYMESYKELVSIDARILCPWYFKGKVLGILVIGNKIIEDDYTKDEKEFIQAICEASAIEVNKINTIEKLKSESENSKSGLNFLQHIDNLQEKILTKSTLKEVIDIAKYEFEELGIIDFSVYIINNIKDKYVPVIAGKSADYGYEFKAGETGHFISFIKNRKTNHRIDYFNTEAAIKESFKEADIKRMKVLWIYPFEIGSRLMGFVLIFNVKDELLIEDGKNEMDNNIEIFSKRLLSDIMNINQIDPDENRYRDNIENLFNSINTELENSKRLDIPLSLIIFSIKNFKRYGSLFGYQKSKELISNFSGLIKNRLSDSDFSVRYDRNKILAVLPGKDKKFSSALANSVRAEFIRSFKKNEMQLLITFLISEFPEDGADLLALIDSID